MKQVNKAELVRQSRILDKKAMMVWLRNATGEQITTRIFRRRNSGACQQDRDIWQMGRHRLMCGDSTDPEDVATLMGGDKLDLVITDPPYNVDYGVKTEMAG